MLYNRLHSLPCASPSPTSDFIPLTMWGRILTAAATGVSTGVSTLRHSPRPPLPVCLSAGRLARLAPSSAVLTASETIILATYSPTSPPSNFLVDFRAKAAAVGVIPGTWARREMQPAIPETLVARLIDRALRPALRSNSVGPSPAHVTVSVLSSAREPSTAIDILAVNAAAAAVGGAQVAWAGPVAAARAALVGEKVVAFPSEEESRKGRVSVFVAVNGAGRVLSMGVEVRKGCVAEGDVMQTLREAVEAARSVLPLQKEFAGKVRAMREEEGMSAFPRQMPKAAGDRGAVIEGVDEEVLAQVYKHAQSTYREAFVECRAYPGKAHRAAVVTKAQQDIIERFAEVPMDVVLEEAQKAAKEVYTELVLKDGLRMDGRGLDEVRLIRCETGVLPGEVHGSALFERGDTQVLACATIGLKSQALRTEQYLAGDERKNFFVHYSFPPYATGESGRFGGHSSRREVGHSALAEQAIRPLLDFSDFSIGGVQSKADESAPPEPDAEENSYPFSLRLSAEVMGSDGSSSMATVCAGSMALMNAGAPLQTAVAGVAMGLVTGPDFGIGEDGDHRILTDILGAEDHFGEMDMKVTGTMSGVTSCQLDIKSHRGLPVHIIESAFEKAKVARQSILSEMAAVCSERQSSTSVNAPRVFEFPVESLNMMKDLVKNRAAGLRGIADKTGTHLSYEGQRGVVIIEAPNQDALDRAHDLLKKALQNLEIGANVVAKVKEVKETFAILELASGNVSGTLHVSKMQINPEARPGMITDSDSDSSHSSTAGSRALRYPDARRYLTKGDEVDVVVLESDRSKNTLRFSLKALRGRSHRDKLANEIDSILAAVQRGNM